MSKYQALIDALAGVNGQLGQPSLHSGHVIYAETEEWCSVDINVKLSANKHISGPLARFIKEAANPSTIRALLADLERAEKALAALAQQAQEPVARIETPMYPEGGGRYRAEVTLAKELPMYANPYNTPPAPQVPAPVDELIEFEASMREKHGWVARDFQSDSFGYFDGHTATAWLAWQARAALQSPAPQAGGWLPIESAPKDGTRLILWWGGKPVFAGWLDNSQCKHPWAGWQTPSLTPRPQGEPTHYMLLPSAPQTKGQP